MTRRRARGARRVPLLGAMFWTIKGLSTALGESTSDWAVHAVAPELAVVVGFVGFVVALLVQFSRRRYVPPAYWLAVVMVGIFGTMAADVMHVALHVPYVASAVLWAAALTVVFVAWYRVEATLSVHEIDTPRREAFYWAAVVSTFALGTALGDVTANTLQLGYPTSALLYATVIAVIGIAFAARAGWADPGVLGRVRDDPSARGVAGRLVRQAHRPGWARRRTRTDQRGARSRHRRARRRRHDSWRRFTVG